MTNTTQQSTAATATPPDVTRELRIQHCFITVDDIDKALDFYHGLVGLPIHTDVTNGDFRWVTVAVPEQPGLEIVLEIEGCQPGMSDADRKAIADLRVKGFLNGVIFEVPDVDALFERLRVGGAEVLQEPADQFYGVRDCAFRDPAGNMIRFNQPLSQS